jgi:hypothetical protein
MRRDISDWLIAPQRVAERFLNTVWPGGRSHLELSARQRGALQLWLSGTLSDLGGFHHGGQEMFRESSSPLTPAAMFITNVLCGNLSIGIHVLAARGSARIQGVALSMELALPTALEHEDSRRAFLHKEISTDRAQPQMSSDPQKSCSAEFRLHCACYGPSFGK